MVAAALAGCSQADDVASGGSSEPGSGESSTGDAGPDRPDLDEPGSGSETTTGAAAAGDARDAGAGGDAGAGDDAEPIEFGDPGDLEGYEPVAEEDVEPIGEVDHEAVNLVDTAPEQIIAEVAVQIDDAGGGGDAAVLDMVDPIDEAAPPAAGSEAGRRNEGGELVRLDESAELACGQVEIAIGRLDDGRVAAASELMASAADSAGASGVADIRSWASPLTTAADAGTGGPSTLVGFLTVCAEGGYEL